MSDDTRYAFDDHTTTLHTYPLFSRRASLKSTNDAPQLYSAEPFMMASYALINRSSCGTLRLRAMDGTQTYHMVHLKNK